MNDASNNLAQLFDLAAAQCEETLTKEQAEQLQELVIGSPELRYRYILYMHIHALAENGWCLPACEIDPEKTKIAELPVEYSVSNDPFTHSPSPLLAFPFTTLHRTISFFSQELPFSLLIAAVLTSLGLWFASMIDVSNPEKIARDSSASPSKATIDPTLEIVGKITGMVDCKWADPQTETFQGANVLFGRKYALASGLMEITYKTGAKVILQGPVTYEVEAKNGGFLPVGRLTGKVVAETAKGFVIRTPSATITDLGTEFGVAVAEQGDVRVHVFAGVVDFQCISQGGQSHEGHRLVAGYSAQIKSGKITVSRKALPVTDFVRVVRNPASTPATPISGTLAYWRFEDNVPSLDVSKQSKTQINVVHDSSNCQNHLDYYGSWGDNGIGNYVASRFVPPSSMFQPGYSGGSKSFNSAALAPNRCGVLFSDSLRHGSPFDFSGDFTLEGFYRTDGDQSRAGPMGIIFKGECSPAYMVSLNRSSLGSVELTLFDAQGKTFAATVADRNYADGQWHYFAARYQVNQGKGGGTVSMLVANENGTVASSVTATPPEFVLNWPNANLFIGRISHWPLHSVSGHFRGLIDEIRICRGALADTDLLFPLQQHKSVSNGGKGLQ